MRKFVENALQAKKIKGSFRASENILCIPQSQSSCINLLSWPDTYAIPKVYQI